MSYHFTDLYQAINVLQTIFVFNFNVRLRWFIMEDWKIIILMSQKISSIIFSQKRNWMKIINIQASKIFRIPKQLHVNIIEKHIHNRHSRQSQVKLHLYSYKGIMKKKTYYKYSIKDSKNKIHFLRIFPSKLRQTHCIPTFFCIQYKRHHLKFTFAFSLSIYM